MTGVSAFIGHSCGQAAHVRSRNASAVSRAATCSAPALSFAAEPRSIRRHFLTLLSHFLGFSVRSQSPTQSSVEYITQLSRERSLPSVKREPFAQVNATHATEGGATTHSKLGGRICRTRGGR